MKRITRRDVSVLRDIALSHLLSRNQLMELGYFGSVNRVNTRMRDLAEFGLVRRLETPFFSQSLYSVTKQAAEVVGERISLLIENRCSSPRFVQHALSTTNVRLALQSKAPGAWRFEQQLWRKIGGKGGVEVRPDGLHLGKVPVFVEVDLGHVAPMRFEAKLASYQLLAQAEHCQALYGFPEFKLLTVTTGSLRARHLRRLTPAKAGYEHRIQTFEEIGAAPIAGWS